MKAVRITLKKYGRTKEDALGGLSGYATDGRWHTAGRWLDYAAQTRSLAALERLVHYKRFDALEPHVIYALEIPDASIQRCGTPPSGWNQTHPSPATQAVGNDWHDTEASPALLVPSVVSPGEFNVLLNTRHPHWRWSWVVSGPEEFHFDPRIESLMRRAHGRRA